MKKVLILLSAVALLASCKQQQVPADPAILKSTGVLHQNMQRLTEVIVHDIFSPPVSSRIYAYTSLAAYEALRFQESGAPSLAGQMQGFAAMPLPEKGQPYNYLLAASKAFFTVAEKLTFSVDSLKGYENNLYQQYASLLDDATYHNSLGLGEAIGKTVLARAAIDNYKQTRGMPKFIGSYDEGKWRPTPPDYLDGAEPYWSLIKTLVADSAGQFMCPPPPNYSTDSTSSFYQTAREVYTIGKNLSEEQKTIARYWDDNPFVLEHAGHLMAGHKKITPVGHWMGIAAIACKKAGTQPVTAARIYALTSAAIFDAIISCWKAKYQYQHIRPITFINEKIDQTWVPYLQTPPFPEHTSGHSGISAAAATVLTHCLGRDFAFEDTSDLAYIGMKRSFSSFEQAAAEASISRVYGGIHYTTGTNAGARQGKEVATHICTHLQTGALPVSAAFTRQTTGSEGSTSKAEMLR